MFNKSFLKILIIKRSYDISLSNRLIKNVFQEMLESGKTITYQEKEYTIFPYFLDTDEGNSKILTIWNKTGFGDINKVLISDLIKIPQNLETFVEVLIGNCGSKLLSMTEGDLFDE